MSNIVPFQFQDHSITVLMDDNGEPWFVAKEVADVLGYSEASAMTRYLDDDEKGLSDRQTPGGRQKVITINESGLYSAILRSERPEAKPFKRWVTHDVLPSIRKTGSYTAPKASSAPRAKGGITRTQASIAEMLIKHGFLEERERPSSKGGTKKFKVCTDPEYGKNLTSPNNPRETQPHWYVRKFAELLDLVLPAKPMMVTA